MRNSGEFQIKGRKQKSKYHARESGMSRQLSHVQRMGDDLRKL